MTSLGENGLEIDNKDTILAQIDQLCSKGKPPAVEYIFVEPAFRADHSAKALRIFGFGHAVIKYLLDGKQRVMNIVGVSSNKSSKADLELVNFLSPQEYLFGLSSDTLRKSEQGGVYNRAMVGIRFAPALQARVASPSEPGFFFLQNWKLAKW